MKIGISAVAVSVLVASLGATLMIGAPSVRSVLANQADTEQEDGIASDSNGRVCNYGPDHDQCHDRFFETLPSTSNYIDYHAAYKIAYADGFKGEVYDHLKAEEAPSESWRNGYIEGWTQGCMDAHSQQFSDQMYVCSR
jgi:hypothetical protein